jgi:hypothetical protein
MKTYKCVTTILKVNGEVSQVESEEHMPTVRAAWLKLFLTMATSAESANMEEIANVSFCLREFK